MKKIDRRLETPNPPLCINCKWCKEGNINLDSLTQYTYICRRPLKKSLVTGKLLLSNIACELERSYESSDRCGEEGKYFEAKEVA